MELLRTPIDQGWNFKNSKDPDSAFLPVAQFPSAIHLDLKHHGKIPDPFLDRNEAAVQWVGEEEWTYQTTFHSRRPNPGRAELVLEGIDTHAAIYLNGTAIQKTDNMFVDYRVDVTDLLQDENELTLHFQSSWRVGKQLEQNAEDKPLFCHNGDASRLQIRKAQYHYGWDWGPTFLTCGPWKPIYLDIFESKVSELSVRYDLDASLSSAEVQAVAEITGSQDMSVKFDLQDPNGNVIATKSARPSNSTATSSFEVGAPHLWYPVGNGQQPLYTLKASCLSANNQTLCTSSKRFGVRRVELIQRPLKDQPGTTFFFQINSIPIFCRGADWIPADSFLPRITTQNLRDWVSFTAKGNQNMIRVWGGGVYEDDAFYDACDEMGVMIWQDFMLGCGSYPATPEFLRQIEHEAIVNIKRMRHHPCVVLWCGNNEDHMFADRYPSGYDPDDQNPENWLKTKWPGRIIYDKVLKDICAEHTSDVPYHPGSPWGGKPSNDSTAGDVHSWGVWMKALEQYPYQCYPKLSGRFVSEFGVKSWPSLKTLEECITDPAERYPQSRTMDAHCKGASKTPWAPDFRNVALYMYENIRHGYSLRQYVYASQFVQAEAMTFAYVGWRRLWKGPGREECAGALAWQLNDCWPVMSWSLADYKMRPKLAYYSVRRACTPLGVGVAREEIEKGRKDEFTRVHVDKETRLYVWGSNFTTTDEQVDLLVRVFELASGKCVWGTKRSVVLIQNRATEFIDMQFPARESPLVATAQLLRAGSSETVARFSDWPQYLRYLTLPTPEITVRVQGDEISISAPLPVKGVELTIDDDSVEFGDNFVDLIPGEQQLIQAAGLKGRHVELMHLGIAAD